MTHQDQPDLARWFSAAVWALATAVVAPGCIVSIPDMDEGNFECRDDDDCGDGWECNGKICVEEGDDPPGPYGNCGSDGWECNDGECLAGPYLVCNGTVDCSDGSDESNCNCGTEEWRCYDGGCIPAWNRCDGAPHCNDGSDEQNCDCPLSGWQCDNGDCLQSVDLLCNGYDDCSDGSDEVLVCANCPPGSWTCQHGYCVDASTRCDWKNDCPDMSDEFDCWNCSGGWTCDNGQCVMDSGTGCNNDWDECFDFSDELSCWTCDASQWTCGNGQCIAPDHVCDGKADCRDNSDEEGCDCYGEPLSSGQVCWSTPSTLQPGFKPDPIALADFDKDGELDIAVGLTDTPGVVVYHNVGAGVFDLWFSLPLANPPWYMATADLNADGYPDLAVPQNGSDTVSIFTNDIFSSGTFTLRQDAWVDGSKPTGVAIGQIEPTSPYPNIVVTNRGSANVSILRVPTFGDAEHVMTIAAGSPDLMDRPEAVRIADLNGDGANDFVVAVPRDEGRGHVAVYLNEWGSFSLQRYYVAQGPHDLTIADFDRNYRPDVAVADNANSSIVVLWNDGSGRFAGHQTVALPGRPYCVYGADINNDAFVDLIATLPQMGSFAVVLGGMDGALPTKTYPGGVAPYSLAIGDLDGHAGLDLVVTDLNSSDMRVLFFESPNSSP